MTTSTNIDAAAIYATFPMVSKFMCRKTGSMDTAEDAAMNGILKAIENVDKYNGKSKVSTWVITVTYRLWLDEIKSHANSKTAYTGDAVFLENMGGTVDPNEVSVNNERDVWDVAREILSDKQFAVVELHYTAGLKDREIAEHLAIPIGSVMSRLNGAKKKLAKSPEFVRLFNS